MLPIQELVDMSRRLDAKGRCALVDQAAAAWGVGEATLLRSSASHVFVADAAAGPVGGADQAGIVLRLRPAVGRHQETLARAALAAERLAAVGAPVGSSRRSLAGRAVEQVGGYVTMAVVHLPGTVYDDEEPGLAGVAARWGTCLAGVHERGLRADLSGLPHASDLLPGESAFAGLDETSARLLARATRETAHALAQLSLDGGVFGVLHGDPEIDNLVFTSRGPVFVDLDDPRRGWFVSDVAFALRAWADSSSIPDWSAEVPAQFLQGYRRVRDLTGDEPGWTPVLVRAAELETLAELLPLVDSPPDQSSPDWATTLHARVVARTAALVQDLIGREVG